LYSYLIANSEHVCPKKTAAGNAPEAFQRSQYPSRDNLHARRTVEPSTATELVLYRKIEQPTRVKTPTVRQNIPRRF
jgi:hypothetical protein